MEGVLTRPSGRGHRFHRWHGWGFRRPSFLCHRCHRWPTGMEYAGRAQRRRRCGWDRRPLRKKPKRRGAALPAAVQKAGPPVRPTSMAPPWQGRRWRNLPEGGRTLAGDNIPGNQPKNGIRPGGAAETACSGGLCPPWLGHAPIGGHRPPLHSRAPAGARRVAGRSVPGVATPG